MRGLRASGANYWAVQELQPPTGSTCVIWLPGQDDAQSGTIRDRSGKGNNGTITGAVWARQSSGLWALDLDGTDDIINCGTALTLGQHTLGLWIKTSDTTNTGIIGLVGTGSTVGLNLISSAPLLLLAGGNYQYWVNVETLYLNGVWHYWELYIAGSGTDDIDNCSLKIDGATIAKDGAPTKTGAPDAWGSLIFGRSGYGATDAFIALERAFTATVTANYYQRERHLFGV